jgi:signal transduction histidine kinase
VATEFDLAALLALVTERFRPAAQEKGITIAMEERGAVMVNGDYDRLPQVFTNIISNAVRYTGRGGIDIAITETQDFCFLAWFWNKPICQY